MNAEIDAVRVAGTQQGPVPVLVLAVDGEDDVVPIFIGFEEAASIARGLEAEDIGRPMTHDLLLDVMEELGGRLDRVVVTEIETREDGPGGTYIADLHVNTPRDSVVIDARPSDSLALAARTNAPIEVTEGVFESGRDDREKFDELDDIRDVTTGEQ
ncbi:bifunctional nuclease family protein [Halobacteria archaeon AArc-m2/3/4]|uniref:Bifunctional nuclease family protein n=1 Tax=Natronoglomus mannanivorans TaxID=2979990 RepID=A0AAP2Z299_9EURY|nr:bifunctional nuclease family protein [Halobacteria archaeon AArc-xg1-1]MCU4974407.1 bifunctional nuclease family protein [Halobacteria archaeon AArc-m2/3/4]